MRLALLLSMLAFASFAAAEPPVPTEPMQIVRVLDRLTIPRLDCQHVSLREVLDFIYRKYHDIDGDPRPSEFTFEYRLTESTLRRTISLRASDVTMAKALEMALKDVDVSFTLERGKLIFTEAPAK